MIVDERTSESSIPISVDARGSESRTQTASGSSKRSSEPASQASRPKPPAEKYHKYKQMVGELFKEFAPQKLKDLDALMEKYSENLPDMYERVWQKYKGNNMQGNSTNEHAAKRRKPEKPETKSEVASSPPTSQKDNHAAALMERFQQLKRPGMQEATKRKSR